MSALTTGLNVIRAQEAASPPLVSFVWIKNVLKSHLRDQAPKAREVGNA